MWEPSPCGCPLAATTALALALVACVVGSAEGGDDGRIKPYVKNPRYWQYKGKPILLVGGSKTDHIFLLDDLKEHVEGRLISGPAYLSEIQEVICAG